jgi:hypothetical protein
MPRVLALLAFLLLPTFGGSTALAGVSGAGLTSAAVRAAGGLPTGSRLLRTVSSTPTAGYAAGGSLYITQTSPVGEHVGEDYELSRVDPRTGRIPAIRRFDDQLDDVLLAGGSLWATTTGTSTTLWRMDPQSLSVRSHTSVPTSRHSEGIAGSLAAAAGKLWVGAGQLDEVSLTSGRVERAVTLPYRGPVQLAADPTGRILIASVGFQHPVHVVRLNPRTGVVLSQRTIPQSASQPILGGILDGGVWIQNTVGSKTTGTRLAVGPLKPSRTSPLAKPTSIALFRVLDGVLWVTESVGQSNLNYCADPVTGHPLVELPPLPGDSFLLAADASTIFYTDAPVNAHAIKLESAPISSRCRV